MSEDFRRAPSPFESFNARALTPDLVAKSFIPPDHFRLLVERKHHLLVGPRGSGKTTLLKMLQPSALAQWNHPTADSYREVIDFTGVFIPTDIAWKSQLDSLVLMGLDEADANSISLSLFCTNVLKSLTLTLEDRIRKGLTSLAFRSLEIAPDVESSISRELADGWNLILRIPSLSGVNLALSKRLIQLHGLAAREMRSPPEGRRDRLNSIDVLFLDFLAATSHFIDVVEANLPSTQGDIWALLFDELELAPSTIRERLLSSLRSIDSRILLKLSMSPYDSDSIAFEDPTSAMAGHDYNEINLTYSDPRVAGQFCRDLTTRILEDAGWHNTDPDRVLGQSILTSDTSVSSNRDYAPDGQIGSTFASLASSDQSFSDYLQKNNLDAGALDSAPPAIRASRIRKVRSIVAVRQAFRSSDSAFDATSRRTRGRKNPALYSGASSLFTISEANPRWLIGVITQLVQTTTKPNRAIPRQLQAAEISEMANRFRALLKTVPTSDSKPGNSRGLLDLLDQIGQYVHYQIVVAPFSPDPVGTFTVDSTTPPWLIDALGKSLNTGAIVHVSENSSGTLISSLKGKRFRLSYALSSYYSIPIHMFRDISLSQILSHRGTKPDATMNQLFLEGDQVE